MLKTTVYLEEESYRKLKAMARTRRLAPAAMVREAVAEYAARHAPRRRPRSIGAYASGRPDLGQAAEELLEGWNTKT